VFFGRKKFCLNVVRKIVHFALLKFGDGGEAGAASASGGGVWVYEPEVGTPYFLAVVNYTALNEGVGLLVYYKSFV
jgi:hypothetical protein